MNSATRRRSTLSQQQPIRLARRPLRSCPTALASSCTHGHTVIQSDATEPRRTQETIHPSHGARYTNQELARVRPGGATESLDGDGAAGSKERAAVDHVGRLLAVLRHDAVGGEAVGGRPELVEAVLGEHRHAAAVILGGAILCTQGIEHGCRIRTKDASRQPDRHSGTPRSESTANHSLLASHCSPPRECTKKRGEPNTIKSRNLARATEFAEPRGGET